MFTKQELDDYKQKLELERLKLEKEISTLIVPVDMGSDVDAGDEEADEAEEFSQNQGTAVELKKRHAAINEALNRIGAGSYGKCQKCEMEIEKEVLAVNPESRFCKMCNKTQS